MTTATTTTTTPRMPGSTGFVDYLAECGMDRAVAHKISDALGLTWRAQLRVVNERVLQDIKDECFGDLVLSANHLDELRIIARDYKAAYKAALADVSNVRV
jgi:hypothetical protein